VTAITPAKNQGNALGIEFLGVCKRYGRRDVLHEVSFAAPAGAVTALLGPNGAGKTTLLRILLGLAYPNRGAALIGGQPLLSTPNPARMIGVVFETFGVNGGFRVQDCVAVRRQEQAATEPSAEALCQEVGLGGFERQRVKRLSLGMRQRLAFGLATAGQPPVLVLDEPFNGLDPEGMRWAAGAIRRQAERGAAVLVSSHLLRDMETVADRAVMIHGGKVSACAAIRDLRDQAGLDSCVLVESDDPARLAQAVSLLGGTTSTAPDGIEVSGVSSMQLVNLSQSSGIALRLLSTESSWLEASYFRLVGADQSASAKGDTQ
jgi:ABC-2 type transport system ATP-binding protein